MVWIYLKGSLFGFLAATVVLLAYYLQITWPWTAHRAISVSYIRAVTIEQPKFWLMLTGTFVAVFCFSVLTQRVPVR